MDLPRRGARGGGLHRARAAYGARPDGDGAARLEPAAHLRRDPAAPRGDRLLSRPGDQEAAAGDGRHDQEDLLDPAPRRGRPEVGQVPQRDPAAPAVLPRVRGARQDREQGAAGGRVGERPRDAQGARVDPHRGPGALRSAAGLPVCHRQRPGGAALHEPALDEGGLPAGDHALDRPPEVLRGAQGVGDHHQQHGARGHRERAVEHREAARRARDPHPLFFTESGAIGGRSGGTRWVVVVYSGGSACRRVALPA